VIFGLDTQRVDTMNAPRRQKNLFRAKGRRPADLLGEVGCFVASGSSEELDVLRILGRRANVLSAVPAE